MEEYPEQKTINRNRAESDCFKYWQQSLSARLNSFYKSIVISPAYESVNYLVEQEGLCRVRH